MPEEKVVVEEEFHLWPENAAAFHVWLSVQTQWHRDNGRRTGLDYQGVDLCIRHMAVPRKERSSYFTAIQAMERAALDEWAKQR